MSEQAHFSAIVDMGPAYRMPQAGAWSRVLDQIKRANAEPEQGDKAEAADMVIGALALFYARGGDHRELVEIMQQKLSSEL